MRQKLRLMRTADAFADCMAARKFCFGGKGGGDAPDYTPVAKASKEAAEIGAKLGREQLAENKRQYNNNMKIAAPIVEQQAGLMRQQLQQGDDYYNYGRSTRPAEQAMLADSFGMTGEEMDEYNRLRGAAETQARGQFDQSLSERRAALDAELAQSKLDDAAEQALAAKQAKQRGPSFYVDESGRMIDSASVAKHRAPMGDKAFLHMGRFSSAQKKAGYSYMIGPDGKRILIKPGGTLDSAGSTPAASSTYKSRTSDIQDRISALDKETYSPSGVDYGEADAYMSKAMLAASNRQKTAEQAEIDRQAGQDASDRAEITGLMSASDARLYDGHKGEIDTEIGTAVADARTGQAASTNQAMRQAMRYGFSPDRMAAMTSASTIGNASMVASAANGARTAGVSNLRQRLVSAKQAGMGMRQSDYARNRGYSLQDKSTNWAKRLDSIGMTKNMVGASQGAYSMANNAGNSAVGNQNATSGQFVNGMNAGTGTIMAGKQMQIGGLSNIMNSQTSMANAAAGSDSSGQIIGAGIGAAATMI